MIQVLTKHSIDEILENPKNYVDDTEDLALVKINSEMVLIGINEFTDEIYFVIEDDEISQDRYVNDEYPGLTVKEAFDLIIKELKGD